MNVQPADLNVTNCVTVQAPARLHLGFLDLNASLGRKFGSIGLAIDSHQVKLSIRPSESLKICIAESNQSLHKKVESLVMRFYKAIDNMLPEPRSSVCIEIISTIPQHAGLGSGTQLALAIGKGLAEFYELNINTPDIAKMMGRGKRSGIGIATFDHGGFIIDGGAKNEQATPPILIQHPYPSHWRIVLIMAPDSQGIHGNVETEAFKTLPSFPISHAQKICHLSLMQLAPSLIEEDIHLFGQAITEIQTLIGDHFAPAQGGRYSSDMVAACLEQATSLGHRGVAQSSWGPTGCIFVDSDAAAETLIKQLSSWSQNQFEADARPKLIKTTVVNSKAMIVNTP